MKKLFRTVFALSLMAATICGLTSCTETETECEHVWDSGVVSVEPTCTDDGQMTYTCTECGEEKTSDIPMLGHDYSGEWVNTDAEGHYHKCSRCDSTDELVAHDMVDKEVITPPTEQSEGSQRTECSVCGYESIKTLPAIGAHSPAEDWSVDETYHWHECAGHEDCGVQLDKGEHSYDVELTDQRVPATCMADGYSVWQCVCGKTNKVVIPKSDALHKWDEGEVTKQPTCTEKGEKTFTCATCGGTKTEEVPALGHKYAEGWINTDPEGHYHNCEVCGAAGEKYKHVFVWQQDESADKHYGVCEDCDYTTELQEHEWDEGVITTPATLYADGVKTYTCKCGKTRTEVIPAKADFATEFTVENQDGAWIYGTAEVTDWSDESFAFNLTQASDKNADSWLVNGSEIKAGWVNAAACTVIGYKVTQNTIADVNLAFKGINETSRVSLRLVVMRGEGLAGRIQFAYDKSRNEVTYEKLVSLKAGDIVYILVQKEGQGDNGMGELTITLTAANDSEHIAGADWKKDGESHWKECTSHLYCDEQLEKDAHNLTYSDCGDGNHKGVCECGHEVIVAHELNEGEVTKQPTCTEAGEKTYTCTVCDATKTEVYGEATGHSYDAEWHFVEGDYDYHYHKCISCGEYDLDGKSAHNWTETERTEATPEADGKVVYTCSDCGGVKEEILYYQDHAAADKWNRDETYHWHDCIVHDNCGVQLDKAEHSFTWTKLDEDNHKGVCECGYEVIVAHVWDEGEVTKQPTCTTEGEKTYTCTVCGETKVEKIPVTEHAYAEEWVSTDPEGHYHTCKVCGAAGEKSAHVYIWEQDEDAGKHYGVCEDCDYTTEAQEHEWDEGVITTPATLYSDGVMTYTCTVCGATRTEAIPAKADFAGDFTVENQDGAWIYGAAEITDWADNSFAFNFTQATEKNADTWLINGSEIKAGWVNSTSCIAIGYKFTQDMVANINFAFIKANDNSIVSARVVVMTAQGSLRSFIKYSDNKNGANCEGNCTITALSGDVVYVLINKESDGDNGMGGLTITLTPATVVADFTNEFTTENQDGAWKYGKVDYQWENADLGINEDFTFTQAKNKNEGGDGWTEDGAEIKSDFISFDKMLAIGYTAESAVTLKAGIIFRGSTSETRANLRVGIKDAEGNIKANPPFNNNPKPSFHNNPNSNVLCLTIDITLEKGDTVYFIFDNGNGGNPEAYPNGNLFMRLVEG